MSDTPANSVNSLRRPAKAPPPPPPTGVVQTQPVKGEVPNQHLIKTHGWSRDKETKSKEPQMIGFRKLEDSYYEPVKTEPEGPLFLEDGEKLLATFYGLLYSRENAEKKWRLIRKEYLPMNFVQVSSREDNPFRIVVNISNERLFCCDVDMNTKSSHNNLFVQWNCGVEYGAKFTKEDKAEQFYNTICRMASTLSRKDELVTKRKESLKGLLAAPNLGTKTTALVKVSVPNKPTSALTVSPDLTAAALLQEVCKDYSLEASNYRLTSSKNKPLDENFRIGDLKICEVKLVEKQHQLPAGLKPEEEHQQGPNPVAEDDIKMKPVGKSSSMENLISKPTRPSLPPPKPAPARGRVSLPEIAHKKAVEEMNKASNQLQIVDSRTQGESRSSSTSTTPSQSPNIQRKKPKRKAPPPPPKIPAPSPEFQSRQEHRPQISSSPQPKARPRQKPPLPPSAAHKQSQAVGHQRSRSDGKPELPPLPPPPSRARKPQALPSDSADETDGFTSTNVTSFDEPITEPQYAEITLRNSQADADLYEDVEMDGERFRLAGNNESPYATVGKKTIIEDNKLTSDDVEDNVPVKEHVYAKVDMSKKKKNREKKQNEDSEHVYDNAELTWTRAESATIDDDFDISKFIVPPPPPLDLVDNFCLDDRLPKETSETPSDDELDIEKEIMAGNLSIDVFKSPPMFIAPPPPGTPPPTEPETPVSPVSPSMVFSPGGSSLSLDTPSPVDSSQNNTSSSDDAETKCFENKSGILPLKYLTRTLENLEKSEQNYQPEEDTSVEHIAVNSEDLKPAPEISSATLDSSYTRVLPAETSSNLTEKLENIEGESKQNIDLNVEETAVIEKVVSTLDSSNLTSRTEEDKDVEITKLVETTSETHKGSVNIEAYNDVPTVEEPRETIIIESPKEIVTPQTLTETVTLEVQKEAVILQAPKEKVTPETIRKRVILDAPKENVTLEAEKETVILEGSKDTVNLETSKEKTALETAKENSTLEMPAKKTLSLKEPKQIADTSKELCISDQNKNYTSCEQTDVSTQDQLTIVQVVDSSVNELSTDITANKKEDITNSIEENKQEKISATDVKKAPFVLEIHKISSDSEEDEEEETLLQDMKPVHDNGVRTVKQDNRAAGIELGVKTHPLDKSTGSSPKPQREVKPVPQIIEKTEPPIRQVEPTPVTPPINTVLPPTYPPQDIQQQLILQQQQQLLQQHWLQYMQLVQFQQQSPLGMQQPQLGVGLPQPPMLQQQQMMQLLQLQQLQSLQSAQSPLVMPQAPITSTGMIYPPQQLQASPGMYTSASSVPSLGQHVPTSIGQPPVQQAPPVITQSGSVPQQNPDVNKQFSFSPLSINAVKDPPTPPLSSPPSASPEIPSPLLSPRESPGHVIQTNTSTRPDTNAPPAPPQQQDSKLGNKTSLPPTPPASPETVSDVPQPPPIHVPPLRRFSDDHAKALELAVEESVKQTESCSSPESPLSKHKVNNEMYRSLSVPPLRKRLDSFEVKKDNEDKVDNETTSEVKHVMSKKVEEKSQVLEEKSSVYSVVKQEDNLSKKNGDYNSYKTEANKLSDVTSTEDSKKQDGALVQPTFPVPPVFPRPFRCSNRPKSWAPVNNIFKPAPVKETSSKESIKTKVETLNKEDEKQTSVSWSSKEKSTLPLRAPAKTTGIPAKNSTVPAKNSTVPAMSTGIPAKTTCIPANTSTIPAMSTGIPAKTTGITSNTSTIPTKSTGITTKTTGIPATSTSYPAKTSTIPANTSNVSASNTVFPAKTVGMQPKFSAFQAKTSTTPANSSSIPAKTTGIPTKTIGAPAVTSKPSGSVAQKSVPSAGREAVPPQTTKKPGRMQIMHIMGDDEGAQDVGVVPKGIVSSRLKSAFQ